MPGAESHYVHRTAWLRAAVLGANDGIISTASLIMGVAAASGGRAEILTAAVAGWAAGAMSMAAGEYVSVSSQADSEAADLARERRALREQPSKEKSELAHIYEERGVQPALARAGGRSADGQGRSRSACARRTRIERGRPAQTDPSRLRIRRRVLDWGRIAHAGGVPRAARRSRESSVRSSAGFSACARRAWRLGGRRPDG